MRALQAYERAAAATALPLPGSFERRSSRRARKNPVSTGWLVAGGLAGAAVVIGAISLYKSGQPAYEPANTALSIVNSGQPQTGKIGDTFTLTLVGNATTGTTYTDASSGCVAHESTSTTGTNTVFTYRIVSDGAGSIVVNASQSLLHSPIPVFTASVTATG